jgi:glycerol-3-phosphate O-acyltransferase/dihydroxyacetone phosphate acyltransferase
VRLSDEDNCLVIGDKTKFLKELAPKKQILLPKSVHSAKAEVVEVISDTVVRVKKEFSADGGKKTAKIRDTVTESSRRSLQFQILPYVDQEEMYEHVYRTLKEGGCIGIFPEG